MRNQYRGSLVSDDTIPYSGICDMTKKMRRVKAVLQRKSVAGDELLREVY